MSNPYKLYLVTDDKQDIGTLVHVVEQAVLGGVTMVQVREKHGDVREFLARANAVKQVLTGTGVPLIINDRVDVALAVDADGVHLGQSDMPVQAARQLLGNDKIIGLSIESKEQLAQVSELSIDYIGLSAIYATATKSNTKMHWGLEGLKYALNSVDVPIVAIGGINSETIPQLWQTGVQGLALVSAICDASDPRVATQQLLSLMDEQGLVKADI